METIYTRRSIRKYKPDAIPEEVILKILKAAMYAPSAGNQQPWQFLVITRRDLLDGLTEQTPNSSMLKQAAAAIVVCGDLERETRQGFWVQDCAAATQNILLEAAFLGVGSVWIGVYPREERVANLSRYFNLPNYIVPMAVVALGYPDEEKQTPDRWENDRVHYNQW